MYASNATVFHYSGVFIKKGNLNFKTWIVQWIV
jgi:hypothetical protein